MNFLVNEKNLIGLISNFLQQLFDRFQMKIVVNLLVNEKNLIGLHLYAYVVHVH
jgi:hypothetical protein